MGAVLLALVIPVVPLVPSPVCAAEHGSSDADNQLEMKAREAFAAGRYDEALDTFAKMYAKTLNPVYLRNIGRCFQKKREPQKAIDEFQDYLAKTKSGKNKISADERAEIEGYIKEMTALRDEQAHAAAVPPTPIAATPIVAAPPPTAPEPATANPPVALLTATPSEPSHDESHPLYTRWWFWTIVGVVVVGGAVATTVALSGTSKPACTASACQ